jgi:Flp pilus assembly pilin Flp
MPKINMGGNKVLNFNWVKRHKGQGMVEYILIIAVVVGIVFVAYKALGTSIKKQFTSATKVVQKADEEG